MVSNDGTTVPVLEQQHRVSLRVISISISQHPLSPPHHARAESGPVVRAQCVGPARTPLSLHSTAWPCLPSPSTPPFLSACL